MSEAFKKLREKGVIIAEYKDDGTYYSFFTNVEDIRKNISRHKYYSNLWAQNFTNKDTMINKFKEKYAKQEFEINEFKEIIKKYIIELDYSRENEIIDEICAHFYKALKNFHRIEVDQNETKISVLTLEDAKKLHSDYTKKIREEYQKEKENKINDYYIPKIMEIFQKNGEI